MKEKIKNMLLGICASIVILVLSAVLVYFAYDMGLLTPLILSGVVLVFLALSALVFWLGMDWKRRKRRLLAFILAGVILLVQLFGVYYLLIGRSALKDITNPNSEYTEISVFVLNEDSAQKIEDIKGYKLGILEVQDRAATNFALNVIKLITGENETFAYIGIEDLVDALFSHEVEAIVINSSFLDLLEENEEYAGIKEKIRVIYTMQSESAANNEEVVVKNKNIFTVYISGIDCSGSISRRSRSDVNILATVNLETGQILLLSTPRDYYVPLSISNGIPDKLTHAGIYGIDVSVDTLEMLYDIEIDYYFRVNFDGFREIIDALGGITVESEFAFSVGKYSYKKGENFLSGEQALAFARTRKSFSGGDRQRGENQMAVIEAVIDKMDDPVIVTNYKGILDGLKGAFETSVPYKKITYVIQNFMKGNTKWEVTSYSVNGKGAHEKPYSLSMTAYVMKPDYATVETAKELMKMVREGQKPVIPTEE